MKHYLIVYATQDGHTRRIAEHIAYGLRQRSLSVRTWNVAELDEPFSLSSYASVLLASPVHLARHDRRLVAFARTHRAELAAMPCRMLSVSLSQAGVDEARSGEAAWARAAADIRKVVARFSAQTGLPESCVSTVAGALMYSRYGFIKRAVMKYIAKRANAGTDTTRDYDYTDWPRINALVEDLASEALALEKSASAQAPTRPESAIEGALPPKTASGSA